MFPFSACSISKVLDAFDKYYKRELFNREDYEKIRY